MELYSDIKLNLISYFFDPETRLRTHVGRFKELISQNINTSL